MAIKLGADAVAALKLGADDVAKVCLGTSLAFSGEQSGGGAPDWVPAGAKIFIEPRVLDGFATGRAWTEVDGIVDVDTLLGNDPNTVNAWGLSNYDPALLDADGLAYGNNELGNFPAFIGSALSKILTGATVRYQWIENEAIAGCSFAMVSEDGNDALENDTTFGLDKNTITYSWNGSLHEVITEITNVPGLNVIAITVTATRMDTAANGSSAIAGIVDDTDRPSDNPLIAALIDFGGSNHLQSITIYDALPDTIGLSALSEIGVTNTAPHDLIATGQNGNTVDGTTITIADTSIASGFAIVTMDATDDEGNPLTITIVGGADAASFDFGFFGVPSALASTTDLGAGSYIVTLRATDPGGLYVEQTFTITVAA